MDFILGCNYWASNAGTEMWRDWDPKAIEKDLSTLSSYGVSHLRVFPNWRDFQPVKAMYADGARVSEYQMENETLPTNPYFLDETMMGRFANFCDLCDKYQIKLIVGLLTGWMSGRLYIPSALYNKNLFTDNVALLFEIRFIKGFVEWFKDRDCIYAWDLGNECNCLSACPSEAAATVWTATISNAIRVADPTRQVVSGMHGLKVKDANWTISGQGEFTDILTTHPYPVFVPFAAKDEIGSYRTTMHATAETKYYSDLSGKPGLVEELGTLGPQVCSNEVAADFLRCNLFSNLANNSLGVMWWCANEQTNLDFAPYEWNCCEVELGMLDKNGEAKPVLKEMKKFADFVKTLDTLPKAQEDAVCVISPHNDAWGIGYMTYALAKQAGVNLRFAFSEKEIPESKVYMIPSVSWINRRDLDRIKERVYNGADLYISLGGAYLSEFGEFAGIKFEDSRMSGDGGEITLDGEKIPYTRGRVFHISATNAEVLAKNDKGEVMMTRAEYGKGRVFFVNFPLESNMLQEVGAFDKKRCKVYEKFFSEVTEAKPVRKNNDYVALTIHKGEEKTYCVAVNHSPEAQAPCFEFNGVEIDQILYGNAEEIPPFDAVIFTVK